MCKEVIKREKTFVVVVVSAVVVDDDCVVGIPQ